jgi:hypothetical protein
MQATSSENAMKRMNARLYAGHETREVPGT